MVKWLNHVAIAAPRNGTLTHTVDPSSGTVVAGSLFTPTAGNFLVVLAGGAVTSTTPAGWTLPAGGSAINNAGLYLWHRTAAGGDTFTTTHNASNYPVLFDVYEFPAGTTFIGVAAQGNVSSGGAGPSLSGLTSAADFRAAVACQDINAAVAPSYTWSTGTEATDTGIIASGTDGYGFSLAYLEDQVDATFSAAATSTVGSPTIERLVLALNVADAAVTGSLVASTPSLTVGPSTAAITGTVSVPVYTGSVAASTPSVTVGPSTASMAGTVAPPTYAGVVAASFPTVTVGPPTMAASGTVTPPSVAGTLVADLPPVTVGPPTMAVAGVIAPPIYSGDLIASVPGLTAGPPLMAASGAFTPPGEGALLASLPEVTVGPPTVSVAGVVAAPTYAGSVLTDLPTITIGPPSVSAAGMVTAPTFSGTLVASLPTVVVGPPTLTAVGVTSPIGPVIPPPDPERTATVARESRVPAVQAESRIVPISAEDF